MSIKPLLPSASTSVPTNTTSPSTSSSTAQPQVKAGVANVRDAFENTNPLVNEKTKPGSTPARDPVLQNLSDSARNIGIPKDAIVDAKRALKEAEIKTLEEKISQERDAAQMNFGVSMAIAVATTVGAGAGSAAAGAAGAANSSSNAIPTQGNSTNATAAKLTQAFQQSNKENGPKPGKK